MVDICVSPGHEAFSSNQLPALNRLLSQLSSRAPAHKSIRRVHDTLRGKWVISVLQGSELIGLAVVTDTSTLSGRRVLVDDVVVSEDYRGNGIGRLIMEKVEQVARQLKARHIEFTSRPAREAANKLYQSMGYQLRETNAYRKELPPE